MDNNSFFLQNYAMFFNFKIYLEFELNTYPSTTSFFLLIMLHNCVAKIIKKIACDKRRTSKVQFFFFFGEIFNSFVNKSNYHVVMDNINVESNQFTNYLQFLQKKLVSCINRPFFYNINRPFNITYHFFICLEYFVNCPKII